MSIINIKTKQKISHPDDTVFDYYQNFYEIRPYSIQLREGRFHIEVARYNPPLTKDQVISGICFSRTLRKKAHNYSVQACANVLLKFYLNKYKKFN